MKINPLKILLLLLCSSFSIAEVTTNTSLSSPPEEDLLQYGDGVMKRVHKQYKDIIKLRNKRYPEFRELLSLDMTDNLKKKDKANICSFGWVNGKFTRRYKQFLTLANAIVANPKKKKFLKPLYNRFKPRQARDSQMQCMLYAKLYDLERMKDGKTLQLNIKFMSPCMPNTITRVFMVNNSRVLPVILILSMGKHKYYFEFDNKMHTKGYGRERREVYDRVKLINFYSEYVPRLRYRWMRYRKPPLNLWKAKAQYEALRVAHGLSRKLIDKHISKPKKLSYSKVQLVKNNNKKKVKTRVLYKKWRFWYIKYFKTGKNYTILPNSDNGKKAKKGKKGKSAGSGRPFHPYAIVKSVWEGNNPNICYQVLKIKGKNHFLYKYIYYNYWYRMTKRRVKFVYRIPTRHYLVNCNI